MKIGTEKAYLKSHRNRLRIIQKPNGTSELNVLVIFVLASAKFSLKHVGFLAKYHVTKRLPSPCQTNMVDIAAKPH